MSRLFDADALRKHIPVDKYGHIETTITKLNIALEKCVVDAVPVVHGHWKGYRFPKYRGNDDFGEPIFKEYVAYTCSNCRKQNAIRHKYCPVCGAIMDGEKVTE